MTTLQTAMPDTLALQGRTAVACGPATRQLAGERTGGWDADIDAWNALIDTILGEWMPDLEALDDGEFTPPSLSVCKLACEVACRWRDADVAPPDRVVMDGDGGISFERRRGNWISWVRVRGEERPTAELVNLKDGKVVFRQEIAVPSAS